MSYSSSKAGPVDAASVQYLERCYDVYYPAVIDGKMVTTPDLLDRTQYFKDGERFGDNFGYGGFYDIEYNKYRESIVALKSRGVVEGYAGGAYKPCLRINRAELLKMAFEAAEIEVPEGDYKNCFPDVEEEWFAKYVCYAKEKGYVSGYEGGYYEGYFMPGWSISFYEALKIIYEVNGNKGVASPSGPEWYLKYSEDAIGKGITQEYYLRGNRDDEDWAWFLENYHDDDVNRGIVADMIVKYGG